MLTPTDHPEAIDNDSGRREALLKTGALQEAIFNSAYFASIATDEKGVIQIFNVGAERMLGYAAAEVVDSISPADLSDPQELIARAAALSLELDTPITPGFEALVFKASRGIEDIYELTYIRKDGSRFPAVSSVTSLHDEQGAIIGYLLIGTDNTARQEVEAARALLDQRLRDQQFYTRSLIESNIDALMTTDPQGIISDVNQQMIALTGRTRDELIGAPCKNFFTDPERADAAIKRVLSEDEVSNYELTVRARNGDETVVSYNAATFHDRDRKLQGVVAAARDVTELKLYEHALQEKNIELERASRMKSEFLATMSHELRTPLNAIIGFSEVLKDGLVGEMSATQREYIGDIFSSGQHLLSLINDILDLSKVEAGMMALELETADLHRLLSNSLSIVKDRAAARGIALELDIAEDLGLPLLDVRKTKQIVYNLLSNAVKFSADGARVTLRARRVARTVVGTLANPWPVRAFSLAQSEYEEFLEISVADAGIGIASENLGTLFQAFSQIDSSLARRFEGTGLGLVMVKLLSELHGGTVAVASADGEGAHFAAWLPLRLHAGAAAEAPPDDGNTVGLLARFGPRLVLLIEDDDHAANLVRLLLETEGFTVLRAADAEAGLPMARDRLPDLILMDVQLPGMDGLTAASLLKQDPATAAIPIIALTALAMEDDRARGKSAGCDAYIAKPLRYKELFKAIDTLLHKDVPTPAAAGNPIQPLS